MGIVNVTPDSFSDGGRLLDPARAVDGALQLVEDGADLLDIGGELLCVPQFTLAADTRSGTRPGFSTAAIPGEGRRLFEVFLEIARERLPGTKSGVFGADMQVGIVNEGPVTFWLKATPRPE